ncbi:hypothetical protein ID866_8925 [Astraeus odoratus]|nr:hypothetical protein ID866_8925 [Astraeus odoratus]
MPRENSFSDSEGRSLTPDLDEIDEFVPFSPPPLRVGLASPSVDPPSSPSAHNDRKSSSVRSPSPRPKPRAASMPVLSPINRFRGAVRKVMHLHRASTIISRYGGAGAEPGADPRRSSAFLHYGHIRENCVITLVDYSSIRSSSGRMTNKEFVSLLNDKQAGQRENWVKVRWINVCGISWDVISALALQYDLHPLAVEDVLHRRGQTRSKADYYPKHLFLRVLSHTLYDPDSPTMHEAPGDEAGSLDSELEIEDDERQEPRTQIPRVSSPVPMSPSNEKEKHQRNGAADEDDRTVFGSTPATWSRSATMGPGTMRSKGGILKRRLFHGDVENRVASPRAQLFTPIIPVARQESVSRKIREKTQLSLEELKKEGRVHVRVQPISIFLLRNGTVISILPRQCADFAEPIMARLHQADTGLRTSADPSLLVQGLLDLVVDSAFEMVDAFHEKILQLEHDVLLRPSMKAVARLHILSGDLTLHKRTLEPLKTVVYGLRRYDVDRCTALVESGERDVKIQGFMSHKAKIYLADVHDHMEYILTSMDTFAGIAENLINYTFNMKSYEMNETMRRLTMATIIFLPLTLLTGYFGMNFESMWSVKYHSDLLFWEIAIPVMVIVIPMFTWPDIRRMVHYAQKRFATRKRSVKVVKTKLA